MNVACAFISVCIYNVIQLEEVSLHTKLHVVQMKCLPEEWCSLSQQPNTTKIPLLFVYPQLMTSV